jgi:hypothetical protein
MKLRSKFKGEIEDAKTTVSNMLRIYKNGGGGSSYKVTKQGSSNQHMGKENDGEHPIGSVEAF